MKVKRRSTAGSKHLMGEEHKDRARLFAEEPSDRTSSSNHKLDHLEFLLDMLENISLAQVAKYRKGCRISLSGYFRMDQTDRWCNSNHGTSFSVTWTDVYLLLCLDTAEIHGVPDFHKAYQELQSSVTVVSTLGLGI